MADFIPRSEAELISWLEIYKNKLAIHGPTTGVSAGDVTAMTTAIDNYVPEFTSLVAKRAELQAKTASVRGLESSLISFVRTQVQRIKTHSAYTPAIGEELQIVGAEQIFDPNTFKPKFKATAMPGSVLIEFTKSQTEGMNIYRRNKGQSAWTFVARDTNSPYEDHTPLASPGVAEMREYALRGVKKDAEIGLMSDIASVTFAG